MTLVVVNQGEEAFLDLITDVDMTLRLYQNDATAGLTDTQIDALTESSFTEATFAGYAGSSMTTAWTTTQGNPSEATRAAVTFTRSTTGASQTIYGYYLTRNSDGKLMWFEKFTGPITVTNAGDAITVTPTLTLDDDKEAALLPDTVSDFEVGSFTFNSTSYGIDNDSGTYADCGVAFVAASTGRALIHWRASLDNDTAGAFTTCSFVLRTGGTIGSGTTVVGASDDRALANFGTEAAQVGMSHLVTGLVPGDTYNVRLEHHVGSNIGTLSRREVIVEPAS